MTKPYEPFGTVHLALYFGVEGKEHRMDPYDALNHVVAELEMFQKINAARDATVSANTEGLVRRDTPATSARAARQVEPRTGSQRARILVALVEHGGMTDHEIAAELGLLENSVRPRRAELRSGGYVIDSGVTRQHRGSHWAVWVATTEARGWYSRQGFGEKPGAAAA